MILYQLKSTLKKRKHASKAKKKSSDLSSNNFSYASYLKERKRFSRIYGKLPSKWLIKYCMNSRALPGKITNNLLMFFERRLDVFLYRIRFCRSIESARQSINHEKVLINGTVINSPSYNLQPGDIIQIKDKINPIWYNKESLMKSIKKKHKLEKNLSFRKAFRRKIYKQYPLKQFRPLSCEINYPLATAIFLYSPQKLYSSSILRPTLFERSFRRTIKK